MRRELIICDVCGAQKQAVNHWFIVSKYPRLLTVQMWNDEDKVASHVCGEACLSSAIAKWAAATREKVSA